MSKGISFVTISIKFINQYLTGYKFDICKTQWNHLYQWKIDYYKYTQLHINFKISVFQASLTRYFLMGSFFPVLIKYIF